MLNLLGRALSGMVLDRDARDAMREAGGLASTLQGSADMRMVIQQLAAARPAVGATPLTTPSTPLASPLADPVVMANAAALQAALLTEILAQARAAAPAPGVAERVSYVERGATRIEPTLAPRASVPAAPVPVPNSNSAATLQAAILAQALASARESVSGAPAPAVVRAPLAPVAPAPAPAPDRGRRTGSSERAQLIQNALRVHAAKQTILANLSDEQRAKLTELASKLLDPTGGAGED